MRMGAIFARGSCTALKWMAFFGVVFALGAGSAAAQPDVTLTSVTTVEMVDEGGLFEVTVKANVGADSREGDAMDDVATVLTVSFTNTAASPVVIGNPPQAEEPATKTAESADLQLLGTDGATYTWQVPTKAAASQPTFKFRVAVNRDVDAEDEEFIVRVAEGGNDPVVSKTVTINDADEQKYTVSLPTTAKSTITEGADEMTLTVKADPIRVGTIPIELALSPNDPTKYLLGDLSVDMFGPTSVTATIEAEADGNRTDDTITVTAYTQGTLGNRLQIGDPLEIKVKDIHVLPGVMVQFTDDEGEALDDDPTYVAEGGMVYFKLARTKAADDEKAYISTEEIDVALSPSSSSTAMSSDFRLSMTPIEIPAGDHTKMSEMVTLEATPDDDVNMEMLVFDAIVSGEMAKGSETSTTMEVLELEIMDTTDKLVQAKSMEDVYAALMAAKMEVMGDHGLNPGENFMLMGSDLFDSMEGVSVSFVAASDSDAVDVSSDGSTITVMPMMATMEGMPAKITVTATGAMPSGVEILDQTRPNVAQVLFPVDVVLEPVTYMISGPEDMNLAEGMSAMVTVTANRGVDADTEVMLMRDGASMAGMDDVMVMPEMATIMAGDMMAEFEVMAVEDEMMEEMEGLTLFAVVDGTQTDLTVSFYLWDAAVPALPLIAQLLLAAFLALGGYRRYLRR